MHLSRIHLTLACSFALLVSVQLVATPAIAVPASLRSEADMRDLVANAMDSMVAGDIKTAYRLLGEHWVLPPTRVATRVIEAQSERAALRNRKGLALGWEVIDVSAAGERLFRIRCLERFDRGVLVWRFVFYRPELVWRLDDVYSSGEAERAFEPARAAAKP